MARPLSWSDVRGGLIALAVLVAVGFGVVRFLRVGALHGDTIRVYALVGEARGVTPGSEVWLSGQKIGKITRIDFRPVETDTGKRIVIEMAVLAQYQPAVHRDASAQIRAGGSFIGAVVVYLTPGTARAPELADGDTIFAKPQGDVEEATSQFGLATRELPAIMSNVNLLVGELKATRGTAGAILNAPGLRGLAETRLHTTRVMSRLSGRGTVGRVMQGGLSARASRVMSRVDSVRALLASPRTSLGRLRRDSTLLAEVEDIRDELAEVQRSLDEPRGTAGRVLRDSAVTIALDSARREMTLLFADIKKHPFRYFSF